MHKALIKFILFFSVATILLPFSQAYAAEIVTVPAEATVRVEEENYAKATEDAIALIFKSAVRMTVAGLVDEKELAPKTEVVEETITSHSVDFIKSYKFLEKKIDNIKGRLEVRLQVTLYLDDLRHAIRAAGITPKKRNLPKLLILIEEKTTGLFTESNFLLLKSISEEGLSKGFQDRGYQVVDRRAIRKAHMGKTALNAVNRNKDAIQKLGAFFEADLILFGKTEVLANKTEKGEHVMAVINLSIISAGGQTIASFREEDDGTYSNVLNGTQGTISSATKKVERALSRSLQKKWRELKEKSDG
ncbi:hypothetical protein MNBD_NITROSPINAE01-1075 [hydrothermal vent metagenome]|uniref:Uncharacterized protein n=1 Tax=hydrothermal vent metagenome TaxID=652676 RepID=A0A3B1C4T4_9ZZZZ